MFLIILRLDTIVILGGSVLCVWNNIHTRESTNVKKGPRRKLEEASSRKGNVSKIQSQMPSLYTVKKSRDIHLEKESNDEFFVLAPSRVKFCFKH